MSDLLTESYLSDPSESRWALDIAALEQPPENDYLRRIWRHAFMLATVGLDNFRYGTSHISSTVWGIGLDGHVTTARVYDDMIRVRDYTGTEYETRFCSIDNESFVQWAKDHGAEQPVIQDWL